MKKLLLLLAIIIGINCQGQVTTLVTLHEPAPNDSLLAICNERGHVRSESCTSTLMYCEPYVVDTDSTSVMIYPPCNWITYTCLRCGATFTEREQERRVVIWRKPKVIHETDEIHPVMNYDSISALPGWVYPIDRVSLDLYP